MNIAARVRPLAAIAVVLVLAGCSSPTPPSGHAGSNDAAASAAYEAAVNQAPVASDAEINANAWAQSVRERGTLRVGGTDLAPLWSLKNPSTGKLTGFDAGISAMLARYILGTPKTELTTVSVDTREVLLQNHSVDAVIATYSITPKRAEKVDFAGPYYQSGASILVRSETKSIRSVADLDGKTVVTQSNSTGLTALKQFAPSANVVTFPDNVQCLAALTQGRVDAYVIDESILQADAVKTPGVTLVGTPFTVDPYGIGLPKDSDAKAFVNDWLRRIEADGSWARLWHATIGTVTQGEPTAPPVTPTIGKQ